MEDASTWASATIEIAEDGTCKKHPQILLKERGEDGYYYKKESCELCDKEFQEQKLLLKEKKKELDRQLEQLDQEDENIQKHFDAAINDEDITNLQSTLESYQNRAVMEPAAAAAAQAQSSAFRMGGHVIPADDSGYTRNPLSLESLGAQMTMMQQMQDWMLNQKETEMGALRQKVEQQQKELLQKEVEIALLKEKLSQQEQRMQQELKLLKIAAMGRKSKGKEIHIQELHVSVGGNIGENGEIDPKKVEAATAAATTAALEGASKAENSARNNPPPPAVISAASSDTSATSNVKKLQPATQESKEVVPAEMAPVGMSSNIGISVFEKDAPSMHGEDESKEEEEGGDTFDADGVAPAWNRKGLNMNRKNPMNASVSSIDPEQPGVKKTQLPTRAQLDASDKLHGAHVPEELKVDGGAPPAVPFNEEVTLGTMDNFSKYGADDEKSIGNTVASSTYGEDRQKVVGQVLLDPYGDKGKYSGVVLRSTGMPHGLGRMVYEEDQRTYEGDWRHGRWHGFGRATFANGDSYEGEYRFDQRHGRGKYCWNDGRIYDGQFSEDKRHGKGTFKWPDGATYDGDFVQGQREGHGRYTFSDGGYYVGNWVDGRYEGFGECHWEDGRQYVGEWRSGMAHGNGIEKYPDGRIRHDGQWNNDEPIRGK